MSRTKRKSKLWIVATACALVLAFIMCVPALASDNISIIVNGERVQTDAPPFIQNGRTLVPIRTVAEALDFYVDWDSSTQEITLMGEVTVFLTVGSTAASVWRGAGYEIEDVTIDVPPVIINNRTFVPLRFIAESFGVDVDWDGSTRTVYIGERPPAPPTPAPPPVGRYNYFPSIPSFGAVTGVAFVDGHWNRSGGHNLTYRGSTSDQLQQYADALTAAGLTFLPDRSSIQITTFMRNDVVVSETEVWVRIVFLDEINNIEVTASRLQGHGVGASASTDVRIVLLD